MVKKLLCAMGVLIVLVSVFSPALAFVRFDFEQKFFSELGPQVKDHSLIRVDGEFHLFYLRGDPGVSIGHATSTDLVHWKKEQPVLALGSWDNLALWAPQVIRSQSDDYVMYYTGVNQYGSQQTGIAMSHDLRNWIKLPWPVYHPDPAWALWGETVFAHGRDPFVLQHDGAWYLLNTAKTPLNRGAISCAVSTDMYTWQDMGPLFTNDSWHVTESVQCIQKGGLWHLFFTEEGVYGTTHMSNTTLFGGWEGRPKTVIDFGHAPEINEFDGHYILSRHTTYSANGSMFYVIRFDTLDWTYDIPQVRKPWPMAKDWRIITGTTFAYQPTFWNNPRARGEDIDPNHEGIGWLSTKELYQGPLGLGAPGAALGESHMGTVHSRTFTITGKSMSLLVGGGNNPDLLYVALVAADTGEILYKETGKNTDEMDRRFWDLTPYEGREAYIRIVDNSYDTFGHICCDDIVESATRISGGGNGQGDGNRKRDPGGRTAGAVPGAPELLQNTPNPFNPTTTISYGTPEMAPVELAIYDVNGARIRTLVSATEDAGTHSVQWDGRDDAGSLVATGIYFYRLSVAGQPVGTRKMMLLK